MFALMTRWQYKFIFNAYAYKDIIRSFRILLPTFSSVLSGLGSYEKWELQTEPDLADKYLLPKKITIVSQGDVKASCEFSRLQVIKKFIENNRLWP